MNIPECLQYITTVVSLECSKMNETNSAITELVIVKSGRKPTYHRKGNWRSGVTLCFLGALMILYIYLVAGVVQSLSHIWLLETPWTTACQAPLSFTMS